MCVCVCTRPLGVDDVCYKSSYYSGFPVEVLNWTSYLVLRGVHCRLCSKAYRSGDWIKKLPCRHVVSLETEHAALATRVYPGN